MAKLRKVQVGPGVVWVEAPSLGWKVLCGCPADVVKNLKRQGLIAEVECAGRQAETGPNAILLSDVMLQNGAFCNLAEFPVLQMLYRQGMILPGHPNNRGEKPLLIGNSKQVDAQLHYIHHGNYGFTTREELAATGMDDSAIDEILAFKKCFAFGYIRHPGELLDTVILEEGTAILKGGLHLTRLALNIFEFRLEDDVVVVDLNLAPGETYEPPYVLPRSCVRRDYFSVVHCGDGNGWDIDRPSMGSILVFQGRVYLIDAGPNIHYTLDALGIGVNEIAGLFHTHCHDDHFAGLTTLLRADHRLKYFATPLVRASVTKKLSALMAINESMFADCFEIHDLTFDVWNHIDGFDVLPLLSPHPVETSIFMFRALWQDGYRTYAHLADVIARDVLLQMLAEPGRDGISEAFFDKVMADYLRPADLKKIDIGGGLIHGMAEDFRQDSSRHIRLSHLDRALKEAEQHIGEASPFGSVDVLIASNQDYDSRDSFRYLRDYFPQAPQAELSSLLNCPIRTDLPGTQLLGAGEAVRQLHLILSGTVERVSADGVIGGGFTAGSMIGGIGLAGRSASHGYRCRSYVKSLVIPLDMLSEFLLRNQLQDELMIRAETRTFLRSTEICTEALAETTLTKLAQSITRRQFSAQQIIDPEDCLALVAKGSVSLSQNGEIREYLTSGAVFNEERAMFAKSAPCQARAEEDCEVYFLLPAAIRPVPVLRWILLEIQGRRNFANIQPVKRQTSAKVSL